MCEGVRESEKGGETNVCIARVFVTRPVSGFQSLTYESNEAVARMGLYAAHAGDHWME